MCVITGIFDTLGQQAVSPPALHRMNDSQHHCGPDAGSLHQELGQGFGNQPALARLVNARQSGAGDCSFPLMIEAFLRNVVRRGRAAAGARGSVIAEAGPLA